MYIALSKEKLYNTYMYIALLNEKLTELEKNSPFGQKSWTCPFKLYRRDNNNVMNNNKLGINRALLISIYTQFLGPHQFNRL